MGRYGMYMPNALAQGTACLVAFGWLLAWSTVHSQTSPPGKYGIGQAATDRAISAWNIDVSPTGEGLPPGRGTAKDGAPIYAAKCASCHGATGVEGPMPRLVGGRGTLGTDHPVKTVGSYWPYATTVYDYVHRAMPYTAPQSLTPDETYAVTAWLLYQNGILSDDAILDASTLPAVQMPNRNGFVSDPRPDVSGSK